MVVQNDTSMKDTNSKNVLGRLHWLLICKRIEYKILTLVHKCMSCKAPEYLRNLLIWYPYSIRRQELRSQNQKRRLIEPRTKLKTFAAQSFSCVGPTGRAFSPVPTKVLKVLTVLNINLRPWSKLVISGTEHLVVL